MLRGGHPEAVQRDPERRADWFDSYLTAVVEREVRDLSAVGNVPEMVAMIRLIADGGVVGVEVKAAATVRSGDVTGLRRLADQVGDRFRRGVALYTGDEAVAFGPGLSALPVHALWTMRGSPA